MIAVLYLYLVKGCNLTGALPLTTYPIIKLYTFRSPQPPFSKGGFLFKYQPKFENYTPKNPLKFSF